MAKGTVNKVIIIGRLGADPEMRYMPDGTAIATLNVATNEVKKDRDTGENQEQTEWHRIVAFGKLGEIIGQYLRKGSKAYFEGRIKTEKWQDKQSGQDRYTTKIIANEMQMLDSRGTGANDSSASYEPATQSPAPSANSQSRGQQRPNDVSGHRQSYEQPSRSVPQMRQTPKTPQHTEPSDDEPFFHQAAQDSAVEQDYDAADKGQQFSPAPAANIPQKNTAAAPPIPPVGDEFNDILPF